MFDNIPLHTTMSVPLKVGIPPFPLQPLQSKGIPAEGSKCWYNQVYEEYEQITAEASLLLQIFSACCHKF